MEPYIRGGGASLFLFKWKPSSGELIRTRGCAFLPSSGEPNLSISGFQTEAQSHAGPSCLPPAQGGPSPGPPKGSGMDKTILSGPVLWVGGTAKVLGCGRGGLPLGQVWGDTPVQKRLLKAEIQNQSGRGLDPPNIHTHTQHDLDPAAPVASPQGRRIEARARPVHRGDPGGPQRRAPATSGRALTSGRCPASPGGPRAQLARPRGSDRRLGPRPASEQLTWRRCKPRPHERAGGRANEREAGRGGAWEGVAGRVT